METVITFLQLLEILSVIASNLAALRFLRALRLIRTVRLVQGMKSLHYFRLLTAVSSCWQPLFWGMFAMVVMTYLFAVLIGQWVTDWRVFHGGNEKMEADPVL